LIQFFLLDQTISKFDPALLIKLLSFDKTLPLNKTFPFVIPLPLVTCYIPCCEKKDVESPRLCEELVLVYQNEKKRLALDFSDSWKASDKQMASQT